MTCFPTDSHHHDRLRIGLLADSHGNLRATRACLRRLHSEKVDLLMHLGDIFDSCGDENLIDLLQTIQQNNIAGVKGNNDYQVEKALQNGVSIPLPAADRNRISMFLKALPMKREINDICFAHSLPYDSIRAFYEPVDTGATDRAARLFNETPYRMIFCGHSHHPVFFRWRAGKVTRETIRPEEPLRLDDRQRYIIVVGSAENEECGLFDSVRRLYQRIRV
jgi:predicted phosphodiesterase